MKFKQYFNLKNIFFASLILIVLTSTACVDGNAIALRLPLRPACEASESGLVTLQAPDPNSPAIPFLRVNLGLALADTYPNDPSRKKPPGVFMGWTEDKSTPPQAVPIFADAFPLTVAVISNLTPTTSNASLGALGETRTDQNTFVFDSITYEMDPAIRSKLNNFEIRTKKITGTVNSGGSVSLSSVPFLEVDELKKLQKELMAHGSTALIETSITAQIHGHLIGGSSLSSSKMNFSVAFCAGGCQPTITCSTKK